MDAVSRTITALFFFTILTSSSEECSRQSAHKFMAREHSYLENESDLALIEKRKKSSADLPLEDWATVLEGANLRNPSRSPN